MHKRLLTAFFKHNFQKQNYLKGGINHYKMFNIPSYKFSNKQKSEEELDLEKMTEEIENFKKKVGLQPENKVGVQPEKKSSINEEQLQELSQFQSFQSASKYASQEQFQLAETQFQEVLSTLNEKYPERIDLQLIIMKRIALMFKLQDKNNLLTPLLEDLYFKHLAFYSYKNVDYIRILKNLLTHYCIYDLERVIKYLLDFLFKCILQ